MATDLHPLASHHLPGFITLQGETDTLMIVMLFSLIVIILTLGNLYMRLHALPERMAHKGNKLQFEIVAVLGLIALFTHNNMFWIAALLLAFVNIPDFRTPIVSIADSLAKMAGNETQPGAPPSSDLSEEVAADPDPEVSQHETDQSDRESKDV